MSLDTAKKFDLNIERILENWEVYHALREIIANALDEQVLTDTKDIEIYQDANDNWHITDYGRGLRYEHLTQKENDEKLANPTLIGKFGIGLKDALATFDRENIKVTINSKYGQITLGKANKHDFTDVTTLHAYISQAIEPNFLGTDFIFNGVSFTDMENAKSLFLKFSGEMVLETTHQGQVLIKKGEHATLYINGVKVATEENFLFSYNITSLDSKLRKALNRERTNVGRSAYSDRVKSILISCKDQEIARFLTSDLVNYSTGTIHDELKWIDVQEHAVKILSSLTNAVFMTPNEMINSIDFVDKAKVNSYEIIAIPDNLKDRIQGSNDITGNPIRDLNQFYKEYEESFEFKFIEHYELYSNELEIFDKTNAILELVGGKPSNIKQIRISETIRNEIGSSCETQGLWDPSTGIVIIKRNQLNKLELYVATLLHEVAHARSGASDASRAFELELTNVIGAIASNYLRRLELGDDAQDKLSGQQIMSNVYETHSNSIIEFNGLEEALRRATPGAVLELQAGEYILNKPLLIDKAMTIKGAGAENTLITCSQGQHVIKFINEKKVAIQDISFEHRGTTPASVGIVFGSDIEISRCYFSGGIKKNDANGMVGNGLCIAGESKAKIIECKFYKNEIHGLLVQDQAQPTLEGNICEGNTSGITYSESASGIACKNVCRDNKFGLLVQDQAKPMLERNICEGNESGIAYSESTSGTARQNLCRNNGLVGIYVQEQAEPTLEGNICEENSMGITYTDNASGIARQNVCRNNAQYGIFLQGQTQPALAENICEENKQLGIIYIGNASGSARQNICHNNGLVGICVQGQAQPMLKENICERNEGAGIVYSGSASGSAYHNICRNNGNGINIQEQALPIIEGNTCEESKEGGIVYSGSTGGIARQNISQNNGFHGIYVTEQAQPRIEDNICQGNKQNGIMYLENASGIARQNICRNNDMHGIRIQDQARPILSRNTCEDNKKSGIAYFKNARGTARQNVCCNNGMHGVYVEKDCKPKLDDNSCTGNGSKDVENNS